MSSLKAKGLRRQTGSWRFSENGDPTADQLKRPCLYQKESPSSNCPGEVAHSPTDRFSPSTNSMVNRPLGALTTTGA